MRQGIGLVEVLVAVAIVALVGVPILATVGTTVQETAVSEDYMFAEALAQKVLAEAMSRPFEELGKDLPHWEVIGGIPERDAGRTARMPAYRANLEGPESFKGQLVIDELARELYRYTVTIEWPVVPGSGQMRRYVLLRLRCPHDLSARVRFPDTESPHRATLEGVDGR